MIIKKFDEIIDKYDTFILDQWGVIHNGGDAFENAVKTLNLLKQHNKKVIILSNSGKQSFTSYARLTDSGVGRDLYHDVMTSGEHMLHNFNSGKFDNLGKNPIFFDWDNDFTIMDYLGFENTDINNASFVLCCGVSRGTADAYIDDLKIAKQRNLELVVSNPDLKAMDPNGALRDCPGAIAKLYEDMGGTVYWFGKPQPQMYELCNEMIGGWKNAIAVGDSLEHDIKGANDAGIDSVFITTGIHHNEINDNGLDDVIDKWGQKPTYSLEWF
ncbi:MAG: TIGR01459 family HAD-type hydrolase [Alphaproteobacteria bacterium]